MNVTEELRKRRQHRNNASRPRCTQYGKRARRVMAKAAARADRPITMEMVQRSAAIALRGMTWAQAFYHALIGRKAA